MGPQGSLSCSQRARHLSLSWVTCIQSTPSHPVSLTSILTLSSHLRVGLPSGLFPSGFPTTVFHTFLVCPMHATCSVHLILLDLITLIIIGEAYKLRSSSLYRLLQPPATFSLSGLNILLSTLFSDIFNPCCSLNVRVQVWHPYKRQVSIVSYGINIYLNINWVLASLGAKVL